MNTTTRTMADHMAERERINCTAELILNAYYQAGALTNQNGYDLRVTELELFDGGKKVSINWKLDQSCGEYDCGTLNVPVSFFDAYDADAVLATAQAALAEEQRIKQEKDAAAAQARQQAELQAAMKVLQGAGFEDQGATPVSAR